MKEIKDVWKAGVDSEINFWKGWLENRKDISDDSDIAQLVPIEDINYCIRDCEEPVKILDVGCGVTSFLACVKLSKKVEITGVDALAGRYKQILKARGINVPVYPIKCDVEALGSKFEADSDSAATSGACNDRESGSHYGCHW